jgi:hypothetical protein
VLVRFNHVASFITDDAKPENDPANRDCLGELYSPGSLILAKATYLFQFIIRDTMLSLARGAGSFRYRQ